MYIHYMNNLDNNMGGIKFVDNTIIGDIISMQWKMLAKIATGS